MDPDLFIMNIHHSGYFHYATPTRYMEGKVNEWTEMHPDYVSIPVIEKMVQGLGIHNYVQFHYCEPGKTLSHGLRPLYNDTDIREMLKCIARLPNHKWIDVYVEHEFQSQVESSDVPEVVHLLTDILAEDNPYNDIPNEVVEVELEHGSNDDNESEDNNEDALLVENFDDSDYDYNDNDLPGICSASGTDVRMPGFKIHNLRMEQDADYESDDLNSLCGSDEEEGPVYPEFRADTDMNNPQFKIGLKFKDYKQFKEAVKEYSRKNGYDIYFPKNDTDKVRAKCKAGCTWVLYASQVSRTDTTFQVKTYCPDHSCARTHKIRHLTSSYLARKYLDEIRSFPNWKPVDMQTRVRRDFNASISRMTAFRARVMARDIIDGTIAEQYKRLWDYIEELKKSNEGSHIEMQLQWPQIDAQPVFYRIYICLHACKEALVNTCRPFICLDGCHLKGPCGGHLLAAVGVDGNDTMYPVAYVVVDNETKDNWSWFLENLLKDVGFVRDKGWTFISDRQKGLIPTFEIDIPEADHRYCVRHLYANFKKKYKGKALKDNLWDAARATTYEEWEGYMKEIKRIDKDAYGYLMAEETKYWSKHAFKTYPKCDMLLNNLCECFNAAILEARDKPIITMLEMIRLYLMTRIVEKREKMKKYSGPICPKIQVKIEKARNASRFCFPIWDGNLKFQVSELNTDKGFVVNLDKKTCSCFKWDLTGIPCKHAIASIQHQNLKIEDFVHPCYLKETYLRTYSYTIGPTNGPNLWPRSGKDHVLPPLFKRAPGRPKKKRKRDPDEPANPYKLRGQNTVQMCSKCQGYGHNRRSCNKQVRKEQLDRRHGTSTFMGFRQTDGEEFTQANQGRGARSNGGRGRGVGSSGSRSRGTGNSGGNGRGVGSSAGNGRGPGNNGGSGRGVGSSASNGRGPGNSAGSGRGASGIGFITALQGAHVTAPQGASILEHSLQASTSTSRYRQVLQHATSRSVNM